MTQQTLNFETTVKAEYCSHCHSRLNVRQERITPGLCRTLRKFYEVIEAKGENSAHLQKDCNFTKSEYCNFSKLRFFYLVGKTNQSGYWYLTERGRRFIEGETVVARRVYVQSGRVIDRSDESVNIKEAMGEMPYWLQKADYVSV